MECNKTHAETEKRDETADFGKITFSEFVQLVADMRHNQRRYFNLRRPDILETCKTLERKVDAVVGAITDPQQRMF